MSKTIRPKILNKKLGDDCQYFIHVQLPGKGDTTRKVEPIEIAYDRIGIRRADDQKAIILDHIPTGWKIGQFRTETKARQAIRELIQITDFKWTTPPPAIQSAVRDILKRYS